MKRLFATLAFACLAPGTLAPSGVTNPAAMARMEAMSMIAGEVLR